MTNQDSRGSRDGEGQTLTAGVKSWEIVHRALNKMAVTSSPRALLTLLARTALDLTNADLSQADLYVPTSKRFVSGGLAGRVADPQPLCSTPHRNPLALTALKRGHPLYQDRDNGLRGFPEGIRYLLISPIPGRSLRGVMMIGYRKLPSPPVREVARILGVLVTQTGLILHQFAERGEAAKQTSHLDLIAEVSRRVAESVDGVASLKKVLDRIRQDFELWGAFLYVGDPLSLSIAQSEGEAPQGVELTDGLVGQAYTTGESLVSNQVMQDARCAIPGWVGADIRSEAVTPLMYGGEVIGVLDCLSARPQAFDPVDTQTLRTLGCQISPLVWMVTQDVGTSLLSSDAIFSGRECRLSNEATDLEMPASGVDTGLLAGASLNEMVAGPILDAALRVLEADGAALYRVHARGLLSTGNHAARNGFDWTAVDDPELAKESVRRNASIVAGAVTGLPWPPSTQAWDNPGGLVVTPASWQGRLHAVLLVAYRKPVDFPEVRVRALQDVVRMAALALAMATYARDGVQQARQWRFLHEIALKNQRLGSPVEVVLEAVDRLCEMMDWQKVEVYRQDETSEGFVLLGESSSTRPFFFFFFLSIVA